MPSNYQPTPEPAAREPVRGDEALAQGALAAGVRVVTGYPGSPATGVLDAILRADDPTRHVQWAPNEKVAMELAFGASLAGSRSLVVLKSVGLNIGLDPLATISLSGCHAGMVILLGDDPGSWSSQNEQDSRWLARVAEVPVVEPTSVEQAGALMVQAFAWSEAISSPLIVRIVGALAQARGVPQGLWELPVTRKRFLRKRNRWVVLPYLVVRQRHTLHGRLRKLQGLFDASPYDVASGAGREGVLCVGYTRSKLRDLLGEREGDYRVLGLASVWPLPEKSLLGWLDCVDRVLVLEEGDAFVEQQLRVLVQARGLSKTILGRETRAVPLEGELTAADIDAALARLRPGHVPAAQESEAKPMPSTVPLCDDCPYRPTFEALIDVMERRGGRKRYIVVGVTGCMVRANLPPMELFDVKYSLGSGLGMGAGLALSDTTHRVVTLVGDSSFFHSEVNAMPYLAQLDPPMLVLVLDNGTTALTGGQAHPGSLADERGRPRQRVAALEAVIAGCGVEPEVLTPEDPALLRARLDEALSADALRVIVVRGPCPRYVHEGAEAP